MPRFKLRTLLLWARRCFRRFTIRDVLWLTGVAALAVSGTAQEVSDTTDNISIARFGRKNVIGLLGQPLGTIVRVTGVCVDGDSTGSRSDAGQTLLEIKTVNGRNLDKPVTFTFSRAGKGVSKPVPGQQFDYLAHEWGSFDGVVQLPGEPAVANDGFYYRRQITIHKDNTTVK